jgi:3-deoxy-D-manno-octulosonic-acid transferase
LLLFYNIFIRLYYWGIRVASLWNKKAAEWIKGRQNLITTLSYTISQDDKIIWMHCSSAGEFEQGKPVIEGLKQFYPRHKLIITFFSPSGFGVAKNYINADYITYIPLDTRENAEDFMKVLQPELIIFIKYEFWFHHLSVAAFHHIPILLVSAVFRENQPFFKKYGGFYRQILFLFRHIFVQDEHSFNLLRSLGISHCSVGGDTRFDRVERLTAEVIEIDMIKIFINRQKVIVAGSTWDGDEKLLAGYLKNDKNVKLILAPHEINNHHLRSVIDRFENPILYSSIDTLETADIVKNQVLVLDSVGLLSRLYSFATLAYVGGGFTKDGIHNILEAAVWGKPVLFGPNYQKYREAEELITAGGGFSVRNAEEMKKLAERLFLSERHLQAVGSTARNYVSANTGATQKILRFIQEKRLLTR